MPPIPPEEPAVQAAADRARHTRPAGDQRLECASLLAALSGEQRQIVTLYYLAKIVPDAAPADRIRAAAAEPAGGSTPRWLPDVLNAIGAMFTVGLLSTLDLSRSVNMTVVLAALALTVIAGYPLLLLRRS
jgi:hypothetical protein